MRLSGKSASVSRKFSQIIWLMLPGFLPHKSEKIFQILKFREIEKADTTSMKLLKALTAYSIKIKSMNLSKSVLVIWVELY